MKREKRKKPSDYPQIAFRVSQDEKEEIFKLIDELHVLANKNVAEDEFRVKKNDLFYEAILIGLQNLKKKHNRS